MANTSPTNGNQVIRASSAPHLSTFVLCRLIVSCLTLNHLSNHSNLPSQPTQYDVRPPSQFPMVATVTVVMGSPPAASMPTSNTSELNGKTVAARKAPMKRPIYPYSSNDSTAKCWRLKIKNMLCQAHYLILYCTKVLKKEISMERMCKKSGVSVQNSTKISIFAL